VVTEKNENLIAKKVARRVELLKQNKRYMDYLSRKGSVSKLANEDEIADDIDDLEEIIGDDAYGAFLDSRAEIQVADKIYKYTDVGLFIVKDSRYNELTQYLAVHNISDDLMYRTDAVVQQEYIQSKPAGIETSIGEELSYYNNFMIAPDEGGGGGGGSYNPPYNPPAEDMATIVNNLKIGEVRKPWLGSIFGTTWVTDDKYESNRRVKVKFYSQDLKLVYAVGCKVKHQFKGWTGLWRKENADKLGIGVNSISWTFSHAINFAEGIPRQVYWIDGKMYKSTSGTDYVNMGNTPKPSLPFAKNVTMDAIIQFTANLSGLNEQQLSDLFWKNAWKQANKFLEGQNKKLDRVAFIVDSFNETYIHYYDFSQVEDNQDVIERIFDWGIATPQFTYTFGGGVGNGTAITSYKFDFLQPKATAVEMYGLAKKNGGWHGVKLHAN